MHTQLINFTSNACMYMYVYVLYTGTVRLCTVHTCIYTECVHTYKFMYMYIYVNVQCICIYMYMYVIYM